MNITILRQKPNYNPDQYDRENADLTWESAVELVQNYPWEEMIKVIDKRAAEGLTFLDPSIQFSREGEDLLIISTRNLDGFSCYYEKNDRFGSQFIWNNIMMKAEEVNIGDIVQQFFERKLDHLLTDEFNPDNSQIAYGEEELLKPRFPNSKFFLPVAILLFPIVQIIIGPEGTDIDLLKSFGVVLVVLLIFSPAFFLDWSYWRNDKRQSITLYPKLKTIKVLKDGKTSEFELKNEYSCEIVRFIPSLSRYKMDNKYIRIKKGDERLLITNFTIDPYVLVDIMKVHHKEEYKNYPLLRRESISKKDRENLEKLHEERFTELLVKYENKTNEELDQIIQNEEEYADYARAAAFHIKKERGLQ